MRGAPFPLLRIIVFLIYIDAAPAAKRDSPTPPPHGDGETRACAIFTTSGQQQFGARSFDLVALTLITCN